MTDLLNSQKKTRLKPWPPVGIDWYYSDEHTAIACGDCREILPELPKVDLVLTDPPYGLDLGNHADSKEKRDGVGLKKQSYESYEDSEENLVNIIIPAVKIALSKAERGIVFSAGTMMWHYPVPRAVSAFYVPSANGRHSWGFNNIIHFMLYGIAPDLNLGSKHTGFMSNDIAEKNGHPCPKPIKWMKRLIELGSRENETILDPFMGSGTTLRAAKDLNRKAIGIELEEKYCEIAVKRLQQEVMQF